MRYGLIDVREWSVLVDLINGDQVDPSELGNDIKLVNKIQKIIDENPYPGDFDVEGTEWVTDVACELNRIYQPQFMMLTYAQQYFLSRYKDVSSSVWNETIDKVFESINRFVTSTGFTPIVIGLGSMTPLKEYIDLNYIDGLAILGGGSVYYSGLYGPSKNDLEKIKAMPGIENVVSKQEFIDEFGGSPDFIRRFPDYLLISKEGYTFKGYGGMGRPMYNLPAKCDEIPVHTCLNTDSLDSLTDIKDLIVKGAPSKKIALIILEGIGIDDFRLDHIKVQNKANWFIYTQSENQYLAITTGKHLQHNNYPPGYRYYIEDGETKKYPFTGPFDHIPNDTIGRELKSKYRLKSAAIGNRSVFMHMASGADVSVECLVRSLYNHGVLAAIKQDLHT